MQYENTKYPLLCKNVEHHTEGNPKIFVCGHSHILKVIPDRQLGVLTINPGAAGKQGWQRVRTLVTLELDAGNIAGCQVIELADDRDHPLGEILG